MSEVNASDFAAVTMCLLVLAWLLLGVCRELGWQSFILLASTIVAAAFVIVLVWLGLTHLFVQLGVPVG